jgi:homoserine acetyltransferase
MMRAQLSLLDDLGIDKLYASVGASMGGMQSLSLAYLAPERVGRVASISATGRSGLGGVGMRYAQRSGKRVLSLYTDSKVLASSGSSGP